MRLSGVECQYVLLLLFPRLLYFLMVFIMVVVTIIGGFMTIRFILNSISRHSVTQQFWLCKCTTPWMLPPLDVLLEYWIGNVTYGLNVMFIFPTILLGSSSLCN